MNLKQDHDSTAALIHAVGIAVPTVASQPVPTVAPPASANAIPNPIPAPIPNPTPNANADTKVADNAAAVTHGFRVAQYAWQYVSRALECQVRLSVSDALPESQCGKIYLRQLATM